MSNIELIIENRSYTVDSVYGAKCFLDGYSAAKFATFINSVTPVEEINPADDSHIPMLIEAWENAK